MLDNASSENFDNDFRKKESISSWVDKKYRQSNIGRVDKYACLAPSDRFGSYKHCATY